MFALLLVFALACSAAAQLPTNCGVPAIRPTLAGSKVVSNTEAVEHSWPWQVQNRRSGEHWCGASILTNGWLLSAAHCTYDDPSSIFTYHAGRHKETGIDQYEQVSKASQIIHHESYNNITNDNDITLVRLQTPFTFNNYVSPVCLADTEPAADTDVWVTGWGMSMGTCCAGKLKQALLAVRDRAACNREWLTSRYRLRITENMLCAGNYTGYPSACHGDSGGPLVKLVAGTDNKFEQVGIVSFGKRYCVNSTLPNVYANVVKYIEWIKNKISQVEAEEALVSRNKHFQPRMGAAFRALAKSLETN